MKQFLEACKIVGTHGIKGDLRVQSWCDSPAVLCGLKTLFLDNKGKEPVTVTMAKAHKNIVLMHINGVDTVQAADTVRNKILYLNRDDITLDDGDFFIEDLIGLPVLDVDTGAEYGTLSDVSFTGANDVYHIKSQSGKEYLIPAIPEVVIETDTHNSVMKIRPIKGIFDED